MKIPRLSITARRRLERARADKRPVQQRIEELRQRSATRLAALFTPPGKSPSEDDVARMRARLGAIGMCHALERASRRGLA